MISVIIPVYNQADKIVKTLSSLEAQTYRDFEVVIVNDGSHDGLDQKLESFFSKNQSNIQYTVLSQKNSGAPAARNKGYRASKGEFLFFCDADAVLDSRALEIMLSTLLEHPESAYVYSSFLWGKKLFKLWPFDAERLKKMPYIHTMSLLRREAFPPNAWDESIKKLQDWDLWLTLLEYGYEGYFIPQVLFKVQPGGKISSWLPAMAYKFLPFLGGVKKYKEAMAIVKKKHNLN